MEAEAPFRFILGGVRARLVAVIALAVLTTSAAASARVVDPPRIVPWHEIGNIGLGMSHKRVERMYGRAINGNPPRDTIIWRYQGRGVIGVTFDANGNVDSLETESAEYATRSGIRVGMRIPLGPCHPVTGKCQYRWNGFTFQSGGGQQYRQWDRTAAFGDGPVRVNAQLWLGSDGRVNEIDLTRYFHCSWGDVVATTCKKPPPPPPPQPPPPVGLRYCHRPGGPGNFLAASPSVPCTTARKVEAKVFSTVCVQRTRCDGYGFTCLAFWDGRYDRPFTYTHHAICRDGALRIEMDEG
jgi:hypothetical protein